MRKVSLLLCLITLFIFTASLIGCGPSKEELVGTWTSEWIYNGKSIESTIYLYKSGEYLHRNLIDGEIDTEIGTFAIDGNKVYLYKNGNKGHYGEYKYRGGKLINNDHEYTKTQSGD